MYHDRHAVSKFLPRCHLADIEAAACTSFHWIITTSTIQQCHSDYQGHVPDVRESIGNQKAGLLAKTSEDQSSLISTKL